MITGDLDSKISLVYVKNVTSGMIDLTFIASVTSESISHLLQKDFGLRSEVLKALSESGFMMNIDKALKFGYHPQETLEIIQGL